jgi:tetrahydromethanopterin S-methyltransferase subunit F
VAILQAEARLERIKADDETVEDIVQRAQKILRENNLAPSIMKALGVQRR